MSTTPFGTCTDIGPTSPALGGDGQRAVLDETAVVDQVGDVLAGGPASFVVAPLGGVAAVFVGADVMAPDRLVEIGADPGAVALGRGLVARHGLPVGFDVQQPRQFR